MPSLVPGLEHVWEEPIYENSEDSAKGIDCQMVIPEGSTIMQGIPMDD